MTVMTPIPDLRYVICIKPGGNFLVGMIMQYPKAAPMPYGFVDCDGQLYSGVVYPELEEVLDYAWGGTRAYALVRVPDLRRKPSQNLW